MPTVDNLDIQISAQVNKANASLTTLINRLDRVSASLMGVNSRGMATMGAGVNKLTNSMQNFSNATKTADFSRLARNLSSIGSIDGERVKAAASGIQSFAGALGALNKMPVSDSSLKIAELAKGISQLGYKSSTQAIDNIPKLATAMSQLMRELSKAPVVSRNLIDMTNALAKLSRTGASSGRAAKSLGNSLDRYTLSTTRATKGTFSLAAAFGKLYATYWLLFRGFRKIGDAINIAADLTEVQNVVDVTFGKYSKIIEDMSKTSIIDFGMSELTVKQISSRFQAMGSAMGFAQGRMADMSVELTKLTADMASFYNVEQKDVAEDLESIFTGQTRPLRTYGLDLTEATLKEWAMKQGMDANIDSMSQMEKTMLRYQYVMANTSAAQGDFARTSQSWANQVRILRQQFEQLGIVIGKTFIAALKPLINALNNAMSHIIAFAQTVSNALGKIFGWKFEVGGGGVTTDLESGADYADDLAGGMSDAANSAKKLKSYLLGIDELNVIEPIENASTGTSGGGGTGGAGGGTNGGEWLKQDSILKEFESEIDTLYELGEYIRDTLIGMMESIDWKSVYEKARGFGKGLAQFLNGILAFDGQGKTIFGEVGKTFANTLNSIVYAGLEFAKEFDFYQFGVNLADGINNFFQNFDFKALAQSLNEWVDGLKEAIQGFLETLTWKDIISGITEFLGTLEIDTIEVLIGAFIIKNSGKKLLEMFKAALFGKISMSNTSAAGGTLSTSVFGSMPIVAVEGVIAGLFLGQNYKEKKHDEWESENVNTSWIEDVKEKYGGFFGLIPGYIDLAKGLTQSISGIPFAIGSSVGHFEALEEAMQKVSDGTIYSDAQLERMRQTYELSEEDVEMLRQSMLDTNPVLRQIADQFGLFDASAETLTQVGTGLNLMEENSISAEDALAELEDLIPGMTEDAKNFFKQISEGNVSFETFKKMGSNISQGVTEGMKQIDGNAVGSDMYSSITEGMANAFDMHSPARKMFPFGENIFLGVVEGFSSSFEVFNERLNDFWSSYVSPWFSLEKWTELYSNIRIALDNVWTETANWWRTIAIYRWYNDDVKSWFTVEKWTFPEIKAGLVSSFNSAITEIKSIWTAFAEELNSKMKIDTEAIVVAGKEIYAGGTISLGEIHGFANGGYVPTSYSMFMAGENGVPELLGTVGGRTAVAGGAEITGIREAVYDAGQAEVEAIQQQNALLNDILSAILNKELIIGDREVVESYDRGRSRMGYSF